MKGKKMLAKVASVVIVFAMLIAVLPALPAEAGTSISVTPEFEAIDCRGLLSSLNTWRARNPGYTKEDGTTGYGKTTPLAYDYGLEEIALKRALEASWRCSHTRPNGTLCFTLKDSHGNTTEGENLAFGYPSIDSAFEAWKEEGAPYAGQGHRRAMLSAESDYEYVAIAGVKRDGMYVWAMEFRKNIASSTTETNFDSAVNSMDKTITFDSDQITSVEASNLADSYDINVGEDKEIDLSGCKAKITWAKTDYDASNTTNADISLFDFATYSSLSGYGASHDTSKVTLSEDDTNDKLTLVGKAAGTTYLRGYWKGYPGDSKLYAAAIPINVTAKTVSSIALKSRPTNNTYLKGDTLDVTGGKITVTYSDSTTQEIDIAAPMVSGFNTSSTGKKTATVTYSGKTVTFPYLVFDKPADMTATYGQTLSNLTVPTSAYGTFAWQDAPSTSVGNVGEHSFNVKFTPTDTNYSTRNDIPVTVKVGKANPSVVNPITITTAQYGQTLNDVKDKLPESTQGTYAFEQPLTTSVGNVGTNSFTAKFTPTDANYNEIPGIIVKIIVSKADIHPAVSISDIEYGETLSPSVTGNTGSGAVTYNYYDAEGSLLGSVPTAPGTYKVEAVIAETANYNGATTDRAEFKINKCQVTLTLNDIASQEYTGSAITPDVDFTVSPSGITLENGTDYTVEYSNNTEPGTAVATIKPAAASNYTFAEASKNFTITPAEIKSTDISLNPSKYVHTGSAITPEPVVTVHGRTLVNGTDYDLSYASNTDVGTATITVTGKGNYKGTPTIDFEIVDKMPLTISGIEDQSHEYTGSPVVLDGTLTVTGGPGTITAENLTETWYDATDNVISKPTNAGSYKVVYSYEDETYIGSKTVNVTITKKQFTVPTVGEKRVETGTALSAIALPEHAVWNDPTATVSAGSNTYPATFTENGDTTNYTTTTFNVTVYGLSKIDINTSVSGGNGNVTPSMAGVLEGTKKTIEFAPDTGYVIDKVLVDGTETSVTDNKLEVTAGTSDITVVVTYKLHDHVMTHHAAVAPTCTKEGTKEYWECSVCNKKFGDAAGTTELSDAEIVNPASGHVPETEWTSDSTGHWHACRQCDEKIDFSEHAYGAWTHTSSHTRTCSVCGYADHENCTYGDWKVTKQPTTTEPGEREHVCSKCGFVEKAEIPATGTQNNSGTSTSTKTNSGKKSPDTGDDSSLLLWSLLLLASIGSGYTVLSMKKKEKSENRKSEVNL